MTEQVPVGTRVRYHGAAYIVRGHNDPTKHPDKRVRDPEITATEYPDETGYELWPADVLYKFGNREQAVYWVRRKSFDVLEEEPGAEKRLLEDAASFTREAATLDEEGFISRTLTNLGLAEDTAADNENAPRRILARDEFERRYAERSNVSIARLHAAGRYAARCNCEDDSCEGWQMAHELSGYPDA